MADVLDKIQKLLALSQSSNENEANVAARAASRLILQHKVCLSLPGVSTTVIRKTVVTHESGATSVTVEARGSSPSDVFSSPEWNEFMKKRL